MSTQFCERRWQVSYWGPNPCGGPKISYSTLLPPQPASPPLSAGLQRLLPTLSPCFTFCPCLNFWHCWRRWCVMRETERPLCARIVCGSGGMRAPSEASAMARRGATGNTRVAADASRPACLSHAAAVWTHLTAAAASAHMAAAAAADAARFI